MNTPTPSYSPLQSGQAIVEALLTLVILSLVLTAVAWLGRYQDIALQASHASRYAAFATARAEPPVFNSIWHSYFLGPSHRWSDRRGQRLLNNERQLDVEVNRERELVPWAQPGQMAANAQDLREQWSVADEGMVDAHISVAFSPNQMQEASKVSAFAAGLRDFDAAYPTLTRHTSILTDAGHASSAEHAQRHVRESTRAWSNASNDSYRLAKQIQTVMNPVDAGWGRTGPNVDWLDAWTDAVPDHHRQNGEQP